jgi:putative nucleotidyltransferase with HDIG domain
MGHERSVGRPRIGYRVAQFADALRAPLRRVDDRYVREHLAQSGGPASLMALFSSMPLTEQHHGVQVCRHLEACGYTDPDLLTAALLHDVGKALAPPHLWERVLVVLVERFAPRRAERWGHGPLEGAGPRRGFVVRRQHAAWGADLAAASGASSQTVELIRRHHHRRAAQEREIVGDIKLLLALQAADES